MDTEKRPKVSIILPTYNRVALLRRAIDSVYSQTFTDWELIVINDASDDDTKRFLDELAAHDSRLVSLHHKKNNYPDISKTLNEGIQRARGKYIARLDDDDYWCDDDKLKKQTQFLEAHPECVVVGTGMIIVDENDKERFRLFKLETDAAIRDKALFANPFMHSTVVFRTDVALRVGGYGDYKNAEDWDLWLKMGMLGKLHNMPAYCVRYLMTQKNKTFIFKRAQSKEILTILRNNRKKYPHFLAAYMLNVGQYAYSLLPHVLRRALYTVLSKTKRSLFSSVGVSNV